MRSTEQATVDNAVDDLIAADSINPSGQRVITALVYLDQAEQVALPTFPSVQITQPELEPVVAHLDSAAYDTATSRVWAAMADAAFEAFEHIDPHVAEALSAPFLLAPRIVTASFDDWTAAADSGVVDIVGLIDESIPTPVGQNEWHLPFITPEDRVEVVAEAARNRMHHHGVLTILAMLRCANPPTGGRSTIGLDKAIDAYRLLARSDCDLVCQHVLTPCECPRWSAMHPTDLDAPVRTFRPDHEGQPGWDPLRIGPGD